MSPHGVIHLPRVTLSTVCRGLPSNPSRIAPNVHAPRNIPLIFYATPPDRCPYLEEREMTTVFADPKGPMDGKSYGQLLDAGFRRSGQHVYRHQCRGCDACVSLRVPAATFRPNRGQRRTWRRNADLQVQVREAVYDPAHFDLYSRYVNQRHQEGGMDHPTPEGYWGFISSRWCETWLVEFLLGGRLACVAVADRVPQGLSAVYTFFDPALERRSPGTFAILWQLEATREQGLPHVYLGYWNPLTPKMAYKVRFQPAQGLVDGLWQRVGPDC